MMMHTSHQRPWNNTTLHTLGLLGLLGLGGCASTPTNTPTNTPAPTSAPAMTSQTNTPSAARSNHIQTIELLGFEGCPNTPAMFASAKAAVAQLGWKTRVVYVDQPALAADDLRRGYPTPTLLVNGRDLFGLPRPTKPDMGCRIYPGGVPDAKAIAEKLRTIQSGNS